MEINQQDGGQNTGQEVKKFDVRLLLVIFLVALLSSGVTVYILMSEGSDNAPEEAENSMEVIEEVKEEDVDEETDEEEVEKAEEVAFDECGILSKYEGEEWFPEYRAKLEAEMSAPENAPYVEALENRFEGCMALDGSIFIAVVAESSYMAGDAQIFKYDVESEELEEATYDGDFGKDGISHGVVLHSFKERNGDHVMVEGYFGDAGFGATWKSNYYYGDNRVELVEKCTMSFVGGDEEFTSDCQKI